MRNARIDNNHKEIVAFLRKMGCSVLDLKSVGKGCPDIAVGIKGKNYFIEIKGLKGKLTPMQKEWHQLWQGDVVVLRSIDEVSEWLERVRIVEVSIALLNH